MKKFRKVMRPLILTLVLVIAMTLKTYANSKVVEVDSSSMKSALINMAMKSSNLQYLIFLASIPEPYFTISDRGIFALRFFTCLDEEFSRFEVGISRTILKYVREINLTSVEIFKHLEYDTSSYHVQAIANVFKKTANKNGLVYCVDLNVDFGDVSVYLGVKREMTISTFRQILFGMKSPEFVNSNIYDFYIFMYEYRDE